MKESTETRIQIINDAQRIEKEVLGAAYQFSEIMGQRKGQALMNGLRHKAPELYEILSGTPNDCFFDDRKVPATLAELGFVHFVKGYFG